MPAGDARHRTNGRPLQAQLVELVKADRLMFVMDRTYPFEQVVEAHLYMATGRERGNVVVV